MLHCVAVCCTVLHCVTLCCSVLQCVAVCCSVLQCVAVCCSVLQCVAVCCSVSQCVRQSGADFEKEHCFLIKTDSGYSVRLDYRNQLRETLELGLT